MHYMPYFGCGLTLRWAPLFHPLQTLVWVQHPRLPQLISRVQFQEIFVCVIGQNSLAVPAHNPWALHTQDLPVLAPSTHFPAALPHGHFHRPGGICPQPLLGLQQGEKKTEPWTSRATLQSLGYKAGPQNWPGGPECGRCNHSHPWNRYHYGTRPRELVQKQVRPDGAQAGNSLQRTRNL